MTKHSPSATATASDDAEAVPGRSTEEIAQLFELDGRESEAIAMLDGGLRRLREVQDAEATLASWLMVELRSALDYRRRLLGGESA